MCFQHWEEQKTDFRFYKFNPTLPTGTGRKDLSFDPDALLNQNPRVRPGFDPRFPDRVDSDPIREAQEIVRPSPEYDMPLPSRYDDRRDDDYRDRILDQINQADLFRYGY